MNEITRAEMQALLDATAKKCGRSMVDHLRFRFRSIFALGSARASWTEIPQSCCSRPGIQDRA